MKIKVKLKVKGLNLELVENNQNFNTSILIENTGNESYKKEDNPEQNRRSR
jgi:hypothetical protein